MSIGATSLTKEQYALIFQMACAPGTGECRRVLHPLALGKVCRTWRYHAWNTPALWQRIDLRPRINHYEVQAQLLKDWLKRTRCRPLDIYFDTPEEHSPERDSPERGFFIIMCRSLLAYACHWRLIYFKLPMNCYALMYRQQIQKQEMREEYEIFKPVIAPKFPSLVSISLQYSNSVVDPKGLPTPANFLHWKAPNVRVLTFTRASLTQRFFSTYPAKSIGALLLDDMHHVHVWNLVTEMSDLRILRLMYPKYSLTDRHRTQKHVRIRHAHLVNLGVAFRTVNEFVLFFDAVSFKYLRILYLTLHALVAWEETCQNSVISFCEASRCQLTKLSITCRILSDRNIIPVLKAMPTLTELCLVDTTASHIIRTEADVLQTGLGSEFFWLFNPESDKSFLPRLELFAYKGTLSIDLMECIVPLVVRACKYLPKTQRMSKPIYEVATLDQVVIYADLDAGFIRRDRRWIEAATFLVSRARLYLIDFDGRINWNFTEDDTGGEGYSSGEDEAENDGGDSD